MLFSFIQNKGYFKGNRAVGLYIFLAEGGAKVYDLVLLKKKGSSLFVEKKELQVNSLEQIFEIVGKSLPIILSVEGKGIISKKVNTGGITSDKEIINHVLTGAKPVDFYIQKVSVSEQTMFVSIIRKQILDSLLEEFSKTGRSVVMAGLGAFHVNNIIALFSDKTDELYTQSEKLIINKGQIQEVVTPEQINWERFRIGSETVSAKDILAFSAGCSYFLPSQTGMINTDKLSKQKQEFIFKKMFSFLGIAYLSLLFILLLVNFMMFSQYSQQNNDLIDKLSENENLVTELDRLKVMYKTKEDFLKQSGFLQSSKLSFYADRLASDLPETITLSKMDLEPLQKKVKFGEQPMFANNTIRIAGITIESTVLNDWIKLLNTNKWIKKVEVINYNQETNRQPGNFEIEIIIE